jgi:hypothetical protein
VDALNRVLPAFAIRQLLDSLENDFARLRRKMYQRVMFGARHTRLRREILNAQQLSRRSLLVNRLQVEFEDSKASIAHETKHVSDMANSIIPNRPAVTLDAALMDGIDWKAGIVQQHVKLLTQALSEHVSILNTWVMYRLQKALLWLTLVYTILTLIAVIANWNQLLDFWDKFHPRPPPANR